MLKRAPTVEDDTLVPVLPNLRVFLPDFTSTKLMALRASGGIKMVRIGRYYYARPAEIERFKREIRAAVD